MQAFARLCRRCEPQQTFLNDGCDQRAILAINPAMIDTAAAPGPVAVHDIHEPLVHLNIVMEPHGMVQAGGKQAGRHPMQSMRQHRG